MNEVYVTDIESNGLLDEITKIHCLVAYGTKSKTWVKLTTHEEIAEFISNPDVIICGHNFRTYDAPALEKVLKVKVQPKVICTLAISWYLNSSSDRKSHSLESYGEDYGVPKIVVGADCWDGDMNDPEFRDLMLERCTRDVEINTRLWLEQQKQLVEIYEGDKDSIHKVIDYMMFKMDCLRVQEEEGLTLDIDYCINSLCELEELVAPKEKALIEAMPKQKVAVIRRKPKNMTKADGSLSALGEKWVKLLEEEQMPEDTEEVEVIKSFEDGNPNSSQQIKDWLYSLGWVPEHLKFDRNKKTGEVKQIPQIKHKTEAGDICDSIKKLYDREPALENLASLSIIKSRINDLKGFIRDMKDDGKLYPSANGFTNTFRIKHRVIVNLPKPSVMFGKYARRCIVAPENGLLCGSDLSSIEDNCKQSFIYPYDPEYVNEMRTDGFDPHISIAVLANLITKEEEQFYKWMDSGKDDSRFPVETSYKEMSEGDQKTLLKKIKEERQKAKTLNFSATYGAGAETISRNSAISLKLAKHLHKVYWERNSSITKFAKDQKVKTVNGQMWVFNPVSRFWITLRTMKDVFSSVNQSCAVYIFDLWLKNITESGIRVAFQYQDEILINTSEEEKENLTNIINEAMVKVNAEVKMNVPLGCSIDFGKTYVDVH